MYARLFNRFLTGSDTLQVYKGSKLLFASNKDRLLPLLEYIDRFAHYHQVVIFDKIIVTRHSVTRNSVIGSAVFFLAHYRGSLLGAAGGAYSQVNSVTRQANTTMAS